MCVHSILTIHSSPSCPTHSSAALPIPLLLPCPFLHHVPPILILPRPFLPSCPALLRRFSQDHSTAALIWNYKTREELREALENEMRAFTVDRVRQVGCSEAKAVHVSCWPVHWHPSRSGQCSSLPQPWQHWVQEEEECPESRADPCPCRT